MAEASNPSSKATSTNYRNLGGINQKASEYSLDKAQFLNLSNLDFDVPNALSKRPGSTQAITSGTSGPVIGLFEFTKLTGQSYVIVGSDTALFYIAAGGLTLLDTGWNNGQPQDMLTFVNKLWVADGGRFKFWNGVTTGASMVPAGLPCPVDTGAGWFPSGFDANGATMFLVGGATMFTSFNNASWIARGVYWAYSYVRSDGYIGPLDLNIYAQNAKARSYTPFANGDEVFTSTAGRLAGFTVPPNQGISAIAIWVGSDTIQASTTARQDIPGAGVTGQYPPTALPVGNLGYLVTGSIANSYAMSVTLRPGADLSYFHLYTLLPASSLFTLTSSYVNAGSGVTLAWGTTFVGGALGGGGFNFASFEGVAGSDAFTGTPFCWFNTNTPKYIDINQNSMFSAGFSNTPSTVWFSEVGQPENIQPEYNFEVRTNDGDRVYAIKTYNNQIMIMKENSFHKVIGDNADNYELVELSTEYGCISDKTVIEYQEKLLWLDKKGILEFNGASWNIISTPVEDIFRRMNLSAAREKAVAVHQLYRNQVWFGIPIDGATQNNMTVVYDYLVNAWTFFEGFNPSSFALIQGGLTKPTVWRGSYSGMVYYHGESFFGDNGQGITCLMRPHWDKLSENETWMWRRFFLDMQTQSGLTGVMQGKLYANYDSTTVQATFSMYQNQFQSRAEFGVPGKSVTGDFSHFSASLPLLVNGFTWARRFLRNV